jgi:hypothetical protein
VVGAEKRKKIIRKIKKLCEDNADIYISVRRDVKKEETSSRGTKQYPVKLDLDIVEENTHYCIYHIKVQRCRRCKSIKSIESFKKVSEGVLTKACSKCLKKISKFGKNYDLTLKRRYWYYKKDAKRDKRKFDLSMSDFDNITSQGCYYCGAWSINNPGKCGIDRVDSDGGYEINNCVACCNMCNFMKRNLTEEDFIEHIKRIYEYSVVKK